MIRTSLAFIALACVSGLTSCKYIPQIGKSQKEKLIESGSGGYGPPPVRGWGLMYPELANKDGAAPTAGPGLAPDGTPASAEGGMFDFSGVVQTGVSAPGRVPWSRSASEAAKQCRVTGKPLLTLFTHQMSQPAQSLESTFLLTPDFREMAERDFILLRLDYSDEDTARSDYYRDFKKRFKANGYPTLLVTTPDGIEIMKVSGYKPEWQARHLQSLKASVIKAQKIADERRKNMEKDGYRLWKNKTGTPVFARLTALDANMGTFTGEWGESFKTFLSRLSDEDQAYIASKRKDI